MLKEISKKLALKKTFFSTQLDGFFNAITQEYQEFIHQKELESSLLSGKCEKLEDDIKNLVVIKNELSSELEIEKKLTSSLQNELHNARENSSTLYDNDVIVENERLKQELEILKTNTNEDETTNKLKQRIKHLQEFISKGGAAYGDSIMSQKSDELIKEISDELKK